MDFVCTSYVSVCMYHCRVHTESHINMYVHTIRYSWSTSLQFRHIILTFLFAYYLLLLATARYKYDTYEYIHTYHIIVYDNTEKELRIISCPEKSLTKYLSCMYDREILKSSSESPFLYSVSNEGLRVKACHVSPVKLIQLI